jgi:hypothetical protein
MSGTFCFELKKNAMIPLPVTTYNDIQTDIFMNNILRNNDSQSNSLFSVKILTDVNITIVERDCGEAIVERWLWYRCSLYGC